MVNVAKILILVTCLAETRQIDACGFEKWKEILAALPFL